MLLLVVDECHLMCSTEQSLLGSSDVPRPLANMQIAAFLMHQPLVSLPTRLKQSVHVFGSAVNTVGPNTQLYVTIYMMKGAATSL